MSTYIQHQYSGKIMRVVSESSQWITIRPVPDDDGPDIGISRAHFNFKWSYYSGEIPDEPQVMRQFVFGEQVDEPVLVKPEKRGRGRPKGSKNKQPASV